MSRKAVITQKEIVDAAFRITQAEGFDKITSRGLAQEAGCSTQPIFRIYENMEALKKDVYDQAASFYESYTRRNKGDSTTPFVNLGMAYIGFAREHPHLFRLLFLTDNLAGKRSMYDLVNGTQEAVSREAQRAKEAGCADPNGLFMRMWIFIHGAACMAVTGDYDLGEEESRSMLTTCYEDFAG
ncbi:MAG: TetR/AcrR family transcriptional regulator [Lachnospiraceae bacterium]|nr:TetR/AcrR family transcriptional regulator [Lachnospiraceae bacterium]